MSTKNESTVVAVFDRSSDAQSAVNDLKAKGFGTDRIFISDEGADDTAVPGSAAASRHNHESGLTGWLHAIFGIHEHADRATYVQAVAGGKTVVSVHASSVEAAQVAEILGRYAPLGVHAEDYAEARGISTPNTDSATLEPGKPDLLNAVDELRAEKAQGLHSAIRVYPRAAGSDPARHIE